MLSKLTSFSPNSDGTTSHSTKASRNDAQVADYLPEGERDVGSLCEAQLNHAWIAAHIPHQGSMCLLDCVETWDELRIQCRAVSHRNVDNPLLANNRLNTVCGIEYAAQAMAVHGALLSPKDTPIARAGYLVSVRGTRIHVPRLDDIAADLTIDATCITRSENNILYQFSVSAAGQLLLDGRAAVVLNAEVISHVSRSDTTTLSPFGGEVGEITSHLVGVFWQLSGMANCSIRERTPSDLDIPVRRFSPCPSGGAS